MSAVKHDNGKIRMSLMTVQFRDAITAVADVLTKGANKYPSPETNDRSWAILDDAVERYTDAFERHWDKVKEDIDCNILAGCNCEARDEELDVLHIDQCITNLLFIRELLYGETNVYSTSK